MSFVPRIYLNPDQCEGIQEQKIYQVSEDIAHYLGNVLRLTAKDPVVLFNERDGEWQCVIEKIGKGKGSLCAQHQLRLPIVPFGPTLVFAPLKRDATDLAVRMATELGVHTIQPVKTAYTNTHRIKEERLQSIVVEAAEQSNRLTIPKIKPILSLFDFCEKWPKDKTLWVAVERCYEKQIPLAKDHRFRGDDGILIGPEGGFDKIEIKNLLLYDFVQPLSLGNLILKAETAVVAGLARFSQYVKA
ncbi:16S rRNA (uracil(1498)-N(3))-methyltransferase [Commensalibacter oyaizuii]|uniref:Ribosomal RNA small subunit methyltransferase E n=1 Tax=Commensalibacter oyaizuii TaxID=3043873 RepID=A0ABT6Q2D2_9PROT|nr:16S rRNA (uracil(1498)-N(3))-methyltransferase [Commensalibacter sp. TBRC 16381]MDI2091254.1 16S rRNA (uracil(1498)-N(3))-methyltransferase [Commensalibacter sp. TBRC 16381]